MEYKFNAGSFGKKIKALFEGKIDNFSQDIEDDEKNEVPEVNDAPITPVGEESPEVEEKEHKAVDELATAAKEVQDAATIIKASEEMEHDNTITKDEHEKIEAKASEKLDVAKEKLETANAEFKKAETEEGNPDIKPVEDKEEVSSDEKTEEEPKNEIDEKAKKDLSSFKAYVA